MPAKKQPHRGRPLLRGADNQRDRLSVRVDPDLREDLMREAHRKRRTLSREVETRLKASLQKPEKKAFGEGRNRALAFLVARLADGVDVNVAGTIPGRGSGSWRTDRFAWEALRHGIAILLDQYAPQSEVRVPERIRQDIEKRRNLYAQLGKLDEMPGYVTQIEKPEGLAISIALGLINQIEHFESPPLNHPKNQIYAQEFYDFPHVKKALEVSEDEQ